MDGYLSILFCLVFTAIAFLWRPTGNNRRYVDYIFPSLHFVRLPNLSLISTLAMSTELAQDEDDAEGRDAEAYDLEAMVPNGHARDDEDTEGGIRLHGGDETLRTRPEEDSVVFEIGDEDDEDTHKASRQNSGNGGYEIGDDDEHESQGLIGGKSSRTDKRID